MNPTPDNQEQARQILRQWMEDHNDGGTAALNTTSPEQDDLRNRIAAALSSRDSEVREVLEGLRVKWQEPELCWCGAVAGEHSDGCNAARALYAKLQPLRSENLSDSLKE